MTNSGKLSGASPGMALPAYVFTPRGRRDRAGSIDPPGPAGSAYNRR